ncbi:hypothetical protein ACFFGT_00015 [Mucilaginibacter angelicae]|uniref:DUF4375 domain-containing protein n=1 Tax=Mucilaginibacter angelicae TaxID=869718 RepID=A0ABV6KYJ4_9SPHI
MGRETYTFRLNEQALSTTLADTLQNELRGNLSFFEYVLRENEQLIKYGWKYINLQQYLSAGEIITTFRSDPAKANVLYLGVAMDWLWESDMIEYSSIDRFNSSFAKYGFEQIYELGQKDKCWVYLNQLYTYTDMNDLENKIDTYDGHYYLWENDVYKDGLDYLLVLLNKVCLDKDYKFSDGNYYTEKTLNFLNDYKKDRRLIEQAELALIDIRAENEEADLKEEANPNYRRSYTNNHYGVAETMFSQIKEVQKSIKEYSGKIFILDSQ